MKATQIPAAEPPARSQTPAPEGELHWRAITRPASMRSSCASRRRRDRNRVELAGHRAQVFREAIRVEDLGQPPQADQAIDRRREIDPAERQFRRQVHAPIAHGAHARPSRIRRTFAAKSRSMVTITSGAQRAPARWRRSQDRRGASPATLRAQELDRLDIDRAAQTRFRARAGRVRSRRGGVARRDGAASGRAWAGPSLRSRGPGLRPVLASGQGPRACDNSGRGVEASVEQGVGDAGLGLDPIGERDVGLAGRADCRG